MAITEDYSEAYGDGWWHAVIHLHPETGQIHVDRLASSDGWDEAASLRRWLMERLPAAVPSEALRDTRPRFDGGARSQEDEDRCAPLVEFAEWYLAEFDDDHTAYTKLRDALRAHRAGQGGRDG